MFTGIVEEIGTIIYKKSSGGSAQWAIKASEQFMRDVHIGDSINVSGACQTVTKLTKDSFFFYSSPHTLQITTLSKLVLNSKINLEKALSVGQRLGGHFVYGHVEGQAVVKNITSSQETISLTLEIPENLKLFVIETGSITVDGISLTVSKYSFPNIQLQIIPHTWQHTTLSFLQVGAFVNIETDPIAKYILQAVLSKSELTSDQNLKQTLLNNGFIK